MTDWSKPAVVLTQRLHGNTYSVDAVKICISFKNATKISLKFNVTNAKFFPTTLTYLKTSKILKIPKITKISKFPKLSQNPTIYATLFFLLAPHVTVFVALWAEACPFASSSTAVPVHHGTEHLMCTKNSNLFLKWGGG